MISLLVVIYVVFISLGLPDSMFGAAWPVVHTRKLCIILWYYYRRLLGWCKLPFGCGNQKIRHAKGNVCINPVNSARAFGYKLFTKYYCYDDFHSYNELWRRRN